MYKKVVDTPESYEHAHTDTITHALLGHSSVVAEVAVEPGKQTMLSVVGSSPTRGWGVLSQPRRVAPQLPASAIDIAIRLPAKEVKRYHDASDRAEPYMGEAS